MAEREELKKVELYWLTDHTPEMITEIKSKIFLESIKVAKNESASTYELKLKDVEMRIPIYTAKIMLEDLIFGLAGEESANLVKGICFYDPTRCPRLSCYEAVSKPYGEPKKRKKEPAEELEKKLEIYVMLEKEKKRFAELKAKAFIDKLKVKKEARGDLYTIRLGNVELRIPSDTTTNMIISMFEMLAQNDAEEVLREGCPYNPKDCPRLE